MYLWRKLHKIERQVKGSIQIRIVGKAAPCALKDLSFTIAFPCPSAFATPLGSVAGVKLPYLDTSIRSRPI